MESPDIASTVRAELARQRKSQLSLQNRLNISRTSMYRRMRGESQFDAHELVIIADYLGLSVADLFPATKAASA
ncbi:MAG: helix-turn-helix transcriptional regulator [Mycobacterium sp.]|nr:helix-turn-helix transcriptional regulator [Mycobacterium sp.]